MGTIFQQKDQNLASDIQGPLSPRKRRLNAWLILLLFTLSLRVISILNCELSIHDTARVAGIAREMVFTGDYFIPRLNGQNFLEYPSLGYLPIALSLGTSEHPSDFLAILPIALLGTATVFLTFLIGKTLADERVGLAAGFFVATMSGFFILHRRCLVDPTLLFFTTLSLYGFIAGTQATGKRFRFFAVFYLAMAGAFLSKGLIGIAIPVGTAVVFLIARKDFAAVRRLYLGRGTLLFLLPILLWVAGVWWLEGSGVIKEVIQQSVRRFLSPTAEHANPFYYYVGPVLGNTLPWMPLPLIWLWYRRKYPSKGLFAHDSLAIFCLVWFLIVFVGLSVASAKRSIYLGPIYPPVALLAALAWVGLRDKFSIVKGREIYILLGIFLIFVGVHFFGLLPSENKYSFRPFFETVRSQRKNEAVYLTPSRESLLGAAVFYLGKRVPILDNPKALPEDIENPSERVFVINLSPGNDDLIAAFQSKGFHLLLQKKIGQQWMQLYSNRS